MTTKTKTKKYYWLKLKEDFFSDDTIEWLEEQPNGKEYCLFYLKLCLKSIKTDGILIRNVGDMLIPYDVGKLAEMTKTAPDTVRVAMEVFKNIGLVQILENGEIYLSQLKNMVGSETSKAQLMRDKRERDKQAKLEENNGGGNNVTKALPKRYTEKELTDRAKDKDKELRANRQTEDKEEPGEPEQLTKEDQEHIELIKDLFASWPIKNNQLLFIYKLAKKQVAYEVGMSHYEYDIRIYDGLHILVQKAKADGVTYIYRWMEKLIPLQAF